MVNVIFKEDETVPKTVFRFETDYWMVSFDKSVSEDLKKKVEKMVDKSKDWPTFLYEFVIVKMTYQKIKDRSIELGKISFEDTVIAICDKWKEKVNLREVTNQTKLVDD